MKFNSTYTDGPKIYGYRHIGMWFLCGLLSFYLVEKLVGGEDDGEEDEKEKDEEDKESVKNGEESVEESSDNDEKMRFSKLIMREREGGSVCNIRLVY